MPRAGSKLRQTTLIRAAVAVTCVAIVLVRVGPARTQTTTPAVAPTTAPVAGVGMVSLDFPENMELKTLLDYVSQRLAINIVYQDEQLANQRVTIKSPQAIPSDALAGLLQSMLKLRGLALTDGDRPGWKRVVPLAGGALPTSQPIGSLDPNQAVTQAFALQYIDAQRVDQLIKPFLSSPAASGLGVSEQHLELVTDYASNMKRIGELVRLIDQPNTNSRIEFVQVNHADAGPLAQQVKQILSAKLKAQAVPGQNLDAVEVTPDKRTGQLIVIGPAMLVDETLRVVKALDVPVKDSQSPIRFYKLANATAADVLDTIRALSGEPSAPRSGGLGASGLGASTASGGQRQPGGAGTSGYGAAGGATLATGLSSGTRTGITPVSSTFPGGGSESATESHGPEAGVLNSRPSGGNGDVAASSSPSANLPPNATALRTAQATVAADTNTNSIIVIGDPSIQHIYEQLILNLDKRRPQVMIEATIVTLDTTNNFQFGVEISAHSKPGDKDQTVTFSNFGLSTPDPRTGQLALIPGVGFNGAVISSDIATVILRALQTTTHAKITSAPRVLVNDNATGTLSSLAEQPFTSNNFNNTVSTTSFGGYAEAGTEITLTPHISEADYLQLEYVVSLSSFNGQGNSGLGIPPPRQKDQVQSKVTVPDGSTVIVGGLNRTNFTRAVNAVPLLGELPVLNYLFSNRNSTAETTTLFIFLRPVILRDDQFADLKHFSERDLKAAGVPSGWPSSEPLLVH